MKRNLDGWMTWNASFKHNKACQDFFWKKGRHWHWLIPEKFRLQYQAAEGGQVRAGARPRIRNPNRQRRGRLRQEMPRPDADNEAEEAEGAEEQGLRQPMAEDAEEDHPPVVEDAAGAAHNRPRRAGRRRPAWLDETTS